MENQLKVTELRIGNTILINGNMYNLELPDLNLIANRNGKSTYSPIPLTEEILLNLLFSNKMRKAIRFILQMKKLSIMINLKSLLMQ